MSRWASVFVRGRRGSCWPRGRAAGRRQCRCCGADDVERRGDRLERRGVGRCFRGAWRRDECQELRGDFSGSCAMSSSRAAQAVRTLLEVRRLAVGRGKRRHLNKLNCASSVQTLFSALAEDALQRANGAPAEAALGDGRWARCRRTMSFLSGTRAAFCATSYSSRSSNQHVRQGALTTTVFLAAIAAGRLASSMTPRSLRRPRAPRAPR